MSLSKWLAKFHGERIDALKAVRKALTPGNFPDRKLIGQGHMVDAWDVGGDKVVKVGQSADNRVWTEDRINKQMKRRGFLDSVLHEAGLAPKTHLVETKKRKYLVQPKADEVMSKGEFFPDDPGPEWLRGKMEENKMTTRDIGLPNVGLYNNKPQVIDSGEEFLLRAMTPAERESALSKFISYGKRPSLEKWIKKNEGK